MSSSVNTCSPSKPILFLTPNYCVGSLVSMDNARFFSLHEIVRATTFLFELSLSLSTSLVIISFRKLEIISFVDKPPRTSSSSLVKCLVSFFLFGVVIFLLTFYFNGLFLEPGFVGVLLDLIFRLTF